MRDSHANTVPGKECACTHGSAAARRQARYFTKGSHPPLPSRLRTLHARYAASDCVCSILLLARCRIRGFGRVRAAHSRGLSRFLQCRTCYSFLTNCCRSSNSAVRWSTRARSGAEDLTSLVGTSDLRYRGYHSFVHSQHRTTPLSLFVRASPYARAYSSGGPHNPATEKAASGDNAPPPATAKPKPKIELRPGPIKSPQASGANGKQPTVPPLSSAKPHPTKPPPESNLPLADAEKELLKEEAQAGLVETVKKDVRDAAAHGVLAPPPEDASWAGRLFHQAKELFVCTLLDFFLWL